MSLTTNLLTARTEQDETVCCPPQKTESSAIKNAVPHPVSEKTGIELKGKIEKLGGFDEVYVVCTMIFATSRLGGAVLRVDWL
jgi:hypothetical protein